MSDLPPDGAGPSPSPEDRARFRAFVRRHHPDVGGDPEVFRRGIAAFRAEGVLPRSPEEEPPDRPDDGSPGRHRSPEPAGPSRTWWPADDDPRLDAPITFAGDSPWERLERAARWAWRQQPWYRSDRVL